jgi:Eukaryotic aspartyl protease
VRGNISYDVITFGDLKTNATFMNAISDYGTGYMSYLKLNGVFALGLPRSGSPPSYASTLYNNNVTTSPQFALFFRDNSMKVYFGDYRIKGYELSKLVSVTPLDNLAPSWNILVDSMSLGGASISGFNVILNPSYLNIETDAASYEIIWNYYNLTGRCNNRNSVINCINIFDDFNLKINGTTLTVSANVLWSKNGNFYTLNIKKSTQWVLGSFFLQNFVSVFNYGLLTVTFVSAFPISQVIYI